MSSRPVFLGGVGARTALGAGGPASAAAARAGMSAVAEHPFFVDRSGQPMRVARAPYLPAEMEGTERLLELAAGALREAAAPLREEDGRVPVVVGLPPARPGRPADLEARVARRLAEAVPRVGPPDAVRTIASGHAAGLAALEEGVRLVASGAADACLAGGADTYLDRETLQWLDGREQLHSEASTWGFGPGEGAAFCLLVSEKRARALAAPPRLRVAGTGAGRETKLILTGEVCVGLGLTAAVRGALEALPPPERVDAAVCDLNGEPYRADEIAFVLARLSDRFKDPAGFRAPADTWGDVGAASGPLFVLLADAAARRGWSAGPRTLLWAGSEDGDRRALLLEEGP